jgi:glycosyltransferase 2 family protein
MVVNIKEMDEQSTIRHTVAPAKKKIPWGRILRPIISIGLLYVLFRITDMDELLNVAKNVNFVLLGITLIIILIALLISAYKWQRLLTVQNVKVSLPRLFNSYLIGQFFNNFLPTNIGGDVMRIHDVAIYTGKTPETVASVVSERLLAALALVLTAAIGLVFSYSTSSRFGWLVIVVFVVVLTIVLLFAIEKWRTALGRKIRLPEKFGLRRWLSGVGKSTGMCLQNKTNVAWVLILSVAFNCTVVIVTYFIFLALGLSVSFVYCLLFVPIISAIQMLPISISGFGIREGAYVYFFGSVGLSSAQAIASSLLFWILVAIVSLAGGVIFALRR